MGKYRMREPWGFCDENHYQGNKIILDKVLNSFFTDAVYDGDANFIQFFNKDGDKLAEIDLSQLKTKDLIRNAEYKDGYLILTFSNGDTTKIDLQKLLDENEFSHGLQVKDGIVSVVIDPSSEPYISVSENGIKLTGVWDEFEKKAEKYHVHTIADISDVEIDETGIVLSKDDINGAIKLYAGKF